MRYVTNCVIVSILNGVMLTIYVFQDRRKKHLSGWSKKGLYVGWACIVIGSGISFSTKEELFTLGGLV